MSMREHDYCDALRLLCYLVLLKHARILAFCLIVHIMLFSFLDYAQFRRGLHAKILSTYPSVAIFFVSRCVVYKVR